MITRLEIDGFKSLRGFAIDLEPLTVLIGPNSAGKSNILDALALLSRLAREPVEEAFKQGRGRALDQFTRHGGEVASTMWFAVEVFVPMVSGAAAAAPPLPNRYRYELTIERRALPSGAERLAIKDERLRTLERAEDRWVDAHPELAGRVEYGTEGREIFKQVAEKKRVRHLALNFTEDKAYEEYICPWTHTAFASKNGSFGEYIVRLDLDARQLEAADALREKLVLQDRADAVRYAVGEGLRILKERGEWKESSERIRDEPDLFASALSSYRLIQLDAARLREPSERIGTDTLAPDASNLPTVLANLPGPLLGEIRADLVSLIPGISSFDVVPDGDAFRIDFELSGGDRLPARLVSDGTLRVLALLTASRVEPRPAVIGIEEPENGVYPGRLRKLFEFLEDMALPTSGEKALSGTSSSQIILTTHSPVALAAFRSRPEHLRFIDLVRRDGQLVTRARPVIRSAGPDRGRSSVSVREIDRLLHSADSELEG